MSVIASSLVSNFRAMRGITRSETARGTSAQKNIFRLVNWLANRGVTPVGGVEEPTYYNAQQISHYVSGIQGGIVAWPQGHETTCAGWSVAVIEYRRYADDGSRLKTDDPLAIRIHLLHKHRNSMSYEPLAKMTLADYKAGMKEAKLLEQVIGTYKENTTLRARASRMYRQIRAKYTPLI